MFIYGPICIRVHIVRYNYVDHYNYLVTEQICRSQHFSLFEVGLFLPHNLSHAVTEQIFQHQNLPFKLSQHTFPKNKALKLSVIGFWGIFTVQPNAKCLWLHLTPLLLLRRLLKWTHARNSIVNKLSSYLSLH